MWHIGVDIIWREGRCRFSVLSQSHSLRSNSKQPHPIHSRFKFDVVIQPCPPTPTPTYDICFRHPPWRDSFFSPSRTANQAHIFRLGSNLRAKSSDKRIAKCRASSSSNYYAYPDSTTSICCHLPHLRCLPPNC